MKNIAEIRSKNTKLVDDDWEEEFNSYADNMMQSMTLEKQKQFLDFYEKIEQHSNHHLKFIEKLHEQLYQSPFEDPPTQESFTRITPDARTTFIYICTTFFTEFGLCATFFAALGL